jgi:hypothetical protein
MAETRYEVAIDLGYMFGIRTVSLTREEVEKIKDPGQVSLIFAGSPLDVSKVQTWLVRRVEVGDWEPITPGWVDA